MTTVTKAEEPCGCGCECCGDAVAVKSKEQEVAELTSLKQAIDARLQQLGV